MADDILGSIKDGIQDTIEDKLSPDKVLSESNLKKKRGAFWTCFIAALLLVVLAAGAALYWNATKVSLFEEGLVSNVDATALGTDEASLKSFADSTLAYLQGVTSVWEPVIKIGDHFLTIPETFKTHMATVKGWVGSATAVLLAGAAIVLLLLGRAMIGTKNSKKGSFSLKGYYIGAAIPLLLIAGVGCWAYFNFDGFWQLLHKTIIPDGIFNASEEIMRLFPVGLFAGYLQPVAITFGILAAIILVLPLILKPLSVLLTNLFGKKSASASGTRSASSRSTTRRSSTRGTSARKSSTTKKSSTAKKTGTTQKTAAKKKTTSASAK